jgi:hypothetical protein
MQDLDSLEDTDRCRRRQLCTHFSVRLRVKGHEPDLFDAGICGGNGLDCRRNGVTSRPAEDACADQRECDASSAEFVGNRAAVAGRQQRAVALTGVIVRADRVDNPPGGQVARGRPSGVGTRR